MVLGSEFLVCVGLWQYKTLNPKPLKRPEERGLELGNRPIVAARSNGGRPFLFLFCRLKTMDGHAHERANQVHRHRDRELSPAVLTKVMSPSSPFTAGSSLRHWWHAS